MKKPIINIKNVSKKYSIHGESFWALQDINLTINQGDRIGIIGNNGSGKTTLLKIISQITTPTSGCISVKGKVASIIELTSGFHPDLTGIENIYLNGMLLGMTREEINSCMEKIIQFSEIKEPFLTQPVYTFSSGMLLRLGFSIALYSNPDIIVLDENIIVGDQDFQKKVYDKVEELFHDGKTIIATSHILPFLKRFCDKIIWLTDGKITKIGDSSVINEYRKQTLFDENKALYKHAKEIFELCKLVPLGECISVNAASSSMEPTIFKGESIKIQRVDINSVKRGDIIAYWNQEIENTVIHRFYKSESKGIVTKGDNNPFADNILVNKDNLLGKIINLAD